MKQVYFDYAAATPMSRRVIKSIEPYFDSKFYNPSAQYLASKSVSSEIEKARSEIAGLLKVRSQEIIFTAGGTESNNLAIKGVMSNYPGKNCVISAIEHHAVLEPAREFNAFLADVNSSGIVNLGSIKQLINNDTVLVSVMYANNEIGTIQPIYEVSKLIKQILKERAKNGIDLPLYLHSDACQAPNYLPVLPNEIGVDLLTLNSGKVYGPKQVGLLFIKNGINVKPLIQGGGQEKNMRSGTENVSGIIGFNEALKESVEMREKEVRRLRYLQIFAYELLEKNIPSVIINGSRTLRLPNNIHLTLPGQDNERLMIKLDQMGFQVAVGSACSASSDEPSHVLKAMGISDDSARSSIRITMGRNTTKRDIVNLINAIQKSINQ